MDRQPGVRHGRASKLDNDRGRSLEIPSFCRPSYVRYFGVGNDCVVVCELLINGRFLVFGVDGTGTDAMDNNSVRWHEGLGLCSQPANPLSCSV